MRIVNMGGRLGLVTSAGVVDVATASDGQFSPHIQEVYDRWSEFTDWAAGVPDDAQAHQLEESQLGAPAPAPRQVFAIGLNYRDHAEEAGLEVMPNSMVVFTKFPSSITGARATVQLPKGSVDFEAELVVVIGKQAHRVDAVDAWRHVAGLTIGQDLSERDMQLRPPTPQFCMAKSFPGFSPMGPALVTTDELGDPDDLQIGCTVNGEDMQRSRTKLMIFPVAEIIARLSATVPLLPGDVIFTGTPAGVGIARNPKVLLQPGDELVTTIEAIGSITTTFTAGA